MTVASSAKRLTIESMSRSVSRSTISVAFKVARDDVGNFAGHVRSLAGQGQSDPIVCRERGFSDIRFVGQYQAADTTASWPQAAWMSRPRVSLTVAGNRARSSAALKAAIA